MNLHRRLRREHENLEALFQDHQRRLLRLEWEEARKALQKFARALRCHLEEEERWAFPVLPSGVGAPRGGDLRIFEGEHARIREALAEVSTWMEHAGVSKDPEGEALEILGRETSFRALLRHHQDREERFLFPLLEVTAGKDRRHG